MKKRILSFLLSLSLIVACIPSAHASAPDPDRGAKTKAIEQLRLTAGDIDYRYEDGNLLLSGKLTGKADAGGTSAMKFLDRNKALFGISDPTRELKSAGKRKDDLGNTFVSFTEEIGGIPVEGGGLTVRYQKNGGISGVFGYVPEDKTVTKLGDTEITADKAIEIAKSQFTFKTLKTEPSAEKLITQKDGKNYAVYRVGIHYIEPVVGSYYVYVEIYSGIVVKTESRIREGNPVTGSGVDAQGKTRTLNLYFKDGRYYMGNLANPATVGIYTYSLHNGTDYGYLVFNSKNSFNSEEYKASVSAHYNTDRVLRFYNRLFGRRSIDGYGKEIDSYTHYGTGYCNAFWDGYELVFGDGDGVNYTYMSGDLDTVAHELTHAVSDYDVGFSYHGQTGAVCESMSDVFGVFIETYDKYNVAGGGAWQFNPADWVAGDELCLPGNPDRAVRCLADPGLYGQPDTMNDYRDLPDTEDGDNGGVHENNGIMNKAAYLIAQQIGMAQTAKIYYRALTYYIGMYTNFEYTADNLIQSAVDLYGAGSAAEKAVRKAFGQVGVTDPIVDNDPYEPNDTQQTAYPISCGITYEAYISTKYDHDYYALLIQSPTRITAVLDNIPASYALYIIGPDGSTLGHQISNSKITLNCEAKKTGVYYFHVCTDSGYINTGKYSLTVLMSSDVSYDPYEPNNSYQTAYVVSPNTEYQAYIPDSNDEDYFRLNLSRESEVLFKLDTCGVSMALYQDQEYWKHIINVIYNSNQSSIFDYKLPAGVYYLVFDNNFQSTALPRKYAFHIIEDFVSESNIVMNTTSAMVNVGDSMTLSAIVNPANATNKSIVWTSNNTNVATVDQQGNVKALRLGTATITAKTVEKELKATCDIIVRKPVTSISLSASALDMFSGGTETLAAKITPGDATYKNVTWASSNPAVATVNNIGKISALQPGTAVITATTMDGGFTASCAVTVSPAATQMALNKTAATINIGQSVSITPIMTPSNAPSGMIYWSTKNGYVAMVDKNGKVTGVSAGTTVITAVSENGGFSATCTVTVTGTLPPPSSISAKSTSKNSITISWTPVSGASGYELYGATSPRGKFTKLAALSGTSFTKTGLPANRTYYFKVRAFKSVISTVFSGYSAVTSAKAQR